MMQSPSVEPLNIDFGRYARFESIPWWDQDRLRSAKVLVIGAGALGNEVIKNLALLGIGDLTIVDMDHIEMHNLTRSVLFRACDAGCAKAEIAARQARDLCPDCHARPIVGNLMAKVGLGWFRRADVIVGALDNREARVFTNLCCAKLGKPWFDGGIEVINGIIRGFHPPESACYECTMSEVDWKIIDQRRSCSMLARQAVAARGIPTTPTTASIIGAIQAQEVVKLLHGMDALIGAGFVFEGQNHGSYRTIFPRKSECSCHEPVIEIFPVPWCGLTTTLREVIDWATQELGGLDAIDLPRELASRFECPTCGKIHPCWQPLETLTAASVLCPECGSERAVIPCHSFLPSISDSDRTLGSLGLPAFDILFARCDKKIIGIEMSADAPKPSIDQRGG